MHRTYPRISQVALCAALATSPLATHAAEVTLLAYASEADFLAPTAKVLSGSRLAQSQKDAPAMVTVIDRAMIDASGLTEIAELIELVPGFVVPHSRQWWPVVGYHVPLAPLRGNFSRRIYEYNARLQVLIDGRSIFSPGLGQVYWRAIPLAVEDIERIEVVHGPNAATYGSNAFEGIVNIITRRGALDPGGRVVARAGERDMAHAAFSHSGERGDLGWRLTLSDRRDRRYDAQPDEAHDRFANGRLDYRLGTDEEASLFFGLGDSSWDDGNPAVGSSIPPHAREMSDGFLQGRWTRFTRDGGEYSLQYSLYRQRQKNEWVVPPANPFALPEPVDQNYASTRQQLEFQAIRNHGDALRLAWGGEWRHDRVTSDVYFNPTGAVSGSILRLFGGAEWRPAEAWLINAGGMAERHYYGETFSPRLSVHYTLAPEHTLRVAATRGYRMPSFYERDGHALYRYSDESILAESLPNPDLGPERIVSAEIGYVGHFPERAARIAARLFQDRISDEILASYFNCRQDVLLGCEVGVSPPEDEQARYFDNDGHSRARGLEVEAQWRPTPSLQAWLGLSWMRMSTVYDLFPTIDGSPEGRFDAWRKGATVMLSWRPDRDWRLAAVYRRVDWSDDIGLEDMDRLDLSLAKTWRWRGQRLEATLALQNLGPGHAGNLRADDPVHRIERRAYLGMKLTF